jgi:hypothetical protein
LAKIKVELGKNETPEQVEEALIKAINRKRECTGTEKFADEPINELLDYVCKKHKEVLDQIEFEVKSEIEYYIRNK